MDTRHTYGEWSAMKPADGAAIFTSEIVVGTDGVIQRVAKGPGFPNADIEAGFREEAERHFAMPVVVNYDGPPPEVIETLNKSPWKTLACRAKATTPVGFGRNSKRQRRQTERLMRAAAKREAKP